jgi:hypothetical protein
MNLLDNVTADSVSINGSSVIVIVLVVLVIICLLVWLFRNIR